MPTKALQGLVLRGALFSLLLLSACKPETAAAPAAPVVDLAGATVLWTGTAFDRADTAAVWTDTCLCVGIAPDIIPAPQVTIVDRTFLCLGAEAYGCAVFDDGIFPVTTAGVYVEESQITLGRGQLLAHEYIHWIFGIGNELHNQAVMQWCAVPYL